VSSVVLESHPRGEWDLFLQLLASLRPSAGNERAADIALDGLDLLTGWCGPGMEIPEQQLA
jgi:hypothetical protein